MISLKEHHTYGPGFFQDRCPAQSKHIDVYYDLAVQDCTKENANRQIAMLLEPKSMIKDAYLFVGAHSDYFRYIFTHDSFLLQFDHAKELNWGNVWLTTDSPKTKGISICTSYKNWCPLHYARLEIAKWYEDRPEVDVFYGDWNDNKPTYEAKDYLEHYKFSIIIENDIDDYWYTEKILNCFATKTIPIYVGARKIDERFNPVGIIHLKDWNDVYSKVEQLYKIGLDSFYYDEIIQDAIEDNFYRVVPYKISWTDRFLHDYGPLLEGMMNGK